MSRLTNKLISGTLILAGITGCSRYVNQSNLEINHQNSYREVVFKDELQGWEDLENLSRNSIDQEEAWVYLPNEKKWVETGVKEGKRKNEIYVEYEPLVFHQLMLKHKDLVSYHLHPINKAYTSDGLVYNATPSGGDIATMIVLSNELPHGKNFKFTSKVCSVYGVMEYYLTEEGRKVYTSSSSLDYVPLKNLFNNPDNRYNPDNRARLILSLGNMNPIEKCSAVADFLSNEDIKVKFTPYPDMKEEPNNQVLKKAITK